MLRNNGGEVLTICGCSAIPVRGEFQRYNDDSNFQKETRSSLILCTLTHMHILLSTLSSLHA